MKTLTSLVATSVLLIGAATANAAYLNQDNMAQEAANSRENVYEFTDEIPDFFSDTEQNTASIDGRPATDNLLNVVASYTLHPDDH
ncbi:hypothetical protein EOL70_04160 [Leucothrix sargassi]|nr:hypothetical protein EOL70_04160 [Leucothrix sargassi]